MKQTIFIGTSEIHFTKYSFRVILKDFHTQLLIKILGFIHMKGGAEVFIDNDNIILNPLNEKNYQILRELYKHGFKTNSNIIDILRVKYQTTNFVIRVKIPGKVHKSIELFDVFLLDDSRKIMFSKKLK